MKIKGFKLGASGRFPQGRIGPDDEGELTMAVGVREGQVVLDFGKPVAWIGFPPADALNLAKIIMETAHKAQGSRTQ